MLIDVIVVNTDKDHSVMAVGKQKLQSRENFSIRKHQDADVASIQKIRVSFDKEKVARDAQYFLR